MLSNSIDRRVGEAAIDGRYDGTREGRAEARFAARVDARELLVARGRTGHERRMPDRGHDSGSLMEIRLTSR